MPVATKTILYSFCVVDKIRKTHAIGWGTQEYVDRHSFEQPNLRSIKVDSSLLKTTAFLLDGEFKIDPSL